jgi:hypothetical protein
MEEYIQKFKACEENEEVVGIVDVVMLASDGKWDDEPEKTDN